MWRVKLKTLTKFKFIFVGLLSLMLTVLGITFIFTTDKTDAAIDWTGHSYTKFTPYATQDGVYLSPIEDHSRLAYIVVWSPYSIIGEESGEYVMTAQGATVGLEGITYEGSQHQGTNTDYFTIRYRIETFTQSDVFIRQVRISAKNASGFYTLYTGADYGINTTQTEFKYGDDVDRDDTFGTVQGSGAYDINMLYDVVLSYQYYIDGTPVRVSAGSVADELSGGLERATTVNPANYTREGYRLDGFWSGENKTGKQVLDENGYFVNDYAATPGITLYPGYSQVFYFDVNDSLDGVDNGAGEYFTFSVKVDGEVLSTNVNDFYQQVRVGSTVEIYDIKTAENYYFTYTLSNEDAEMEDSSSSNIKIQMPQEEFELKINIKFVQYWTDDSAQEELGVNFTNYTLYGTGTADDPYLIQSETDLAFLSWTIYNNKAYNGNVTSSNYFYSGKYFKQTKDLDMSAYSWQPIGSSRYFSGNYNGGGFTVSGLYTSAGSNNAYSYQGLFGRVCTYNTVAVSITNIGVIDSFIQGYDYVGGVVGYVYIDSNSNSQVTISNCYNTGTVTSTSTSSYSYVGGVVGYADSSFSSLKVTITNCYNTGAVTSTSTSSYSSVGGVVGRAYATIANCYNTGAVTGSSYVGGVVGYASGSTITNCYNTGAVEGYNLVGGVVGYITGIMSNCYNTGSVTGISSVGGVVGQGHFNPIITDCYNIGPVTATLTTEDITGTSSIVQYVGGLIGSAVGDNPSFPTIKNCYNAGSVTATLSVTSTTDIYQSVGGLIGDSTFSTVTNCYNIGSIVTKFESNSTNTNNYVGGLLGEATHAGGDVAAVIFNCYNTGSVSITSTSSVQYIGGVIGCFRFNSYASDTNKDPNNLYYGGECTLTTGIGSGEGTATKIDAPVEEWAKNIDWYSVSATNEDGSLVWDSAYPWDFDTVWEFGRPHFANFNNNYPVLQGMWSTNGTEVIYWTDTEAQTTLGVDFTNYSLSGSGNSVDDPYLIQSETDLAFLSWTIYNNKAYNGNVTSGNYFYSGKYFKQTKNLDMSAYYWQPIGILYLRDGTSTSRYFSGNYDGCGFVVSGLYTPAVPEGITTQQQEVYSYQGLFGYVYGYSSSKTANISNIGVAKSVIRGYTYLGALVGWVDYNVTITNCYNTGSVIGNNYVGGIVGLSNASDIRNCHNAGVVTGSDYVGGIIGYIYNPSLLENCYNTGSVIGSNDVGGIVGYAGSNTAITACGVETEQIFGNNNVGIITGFYSSSYFVTNCYGIVGVDIGFVGSGDYDNCVWITNVDGNQNKFYKGSDFSAFAWFNQNSCPIPKSLSILGELFTSDITPTLISSAEWQAVA